MVYIQYHYYMRYHLQYFTSEFSLYYNKLYIVFNYY